MEFPRKGFMICLNEENPNDCNPIHYNISKGLIKKVFESKSEKGKFIFQTMGQTLGSFTIERTLRENKVPMVSEKTWTSGAIAFLGSLQKQSAIDIVVTFQTQEKTKETEKNNIQRVLCSIDQTKLYDTLVLNWKILIEIPNFNLLTIINE